MLKFLKDKNVSLKVRLLQFKIDVAYMTDLFVKFIIIDLQFQGDELYLITKKLIISLKKSLYRTIILVAKSSVTFQSCSSVQEQ